MAKYNTEQKKALLNYLSQHEDRQYSAEELSALLAEGEGEGKAPGKSTVYRLVTELADEGILRRFPKNEGRGWLYQYHRRSDCSGHLHLKCTECGKLLHLECGMSDGLLMHIEEIHRFKVDNNASVLYGLCADCRGDKDDTPRLPLKKEPCRHHS